MCRVLHGRVHFYRSDKAEAFADVHWHCYHRPPLCYYLFQLRAHWLWIPWFIRSEHVPPVGDEPSTSRMMMNTLSTRLSTPLFHLNYWCYLSFKAAKTKVLPVTVTSTEKCFHPESSFAIYAWVVLKVKGYIFNNLFLCVYNYKYKPPPSLKYPEDRKKTA